MTGISGYFSDTAAGISGEITGLEPMSLSMIPTTITFPPPAYTSAGFAYDNLIYLSGAPNVAATGPSIFLSVGDLLDEYGLAFDVQGGYTVDLWGGRSAPDAAPVYTVADAQRSVILDENPNATVNLTPEPGSLVLLGTGLTAIAGIFRRRQGKSCALPV